VVKERFRAQAAKVCRIAREVWYKIPLEARTAILKHWHSPGVNPEVSLVPAEGFRLNEAPGRTEGKGRKISFDVETLGRLKDEWIGLAITHEMAHVSLFADGDAAHAAAEPREPAPHAE
jgi:hypothetical protein